MKTTLELLKDLTSAKGVSGHEKEVNHMMIQNMKDFSDITQDKMNNLIIRLHNYDETKPNIMIDCHADEVGFLVQNIQSNGMINLSPLGSWFTPNLMGSTLWIGNEKGEYFMGIVGSTPPHLLKDSERNQIPAIGSLFVDIGAHSAQQVEDIFGISIGCPVVPYSTFHYNEKTNKIFAKALDNRLGCTLMMETLYAFKDVDLPFNLVGSSSTQEEVGLRGSHITTEIIKPIAALVFESTPADDVYTGITQTAVGKGPQVRYKDTTILTSYELVQFTKKLAQKASIPLQLVVRDTGGTNAGTIHLKHQGIPTLPLSVPTRYIHSHTALCDFQDYEYTKKLAHIWIESISNFL